MFEVQTAQLCSLSMMILKRQSFTKRSYIYIYIHTYLIVNKWNREAYKLLQYNVPSNFWVFTVFLSHIYIADISCRTYTKFSNFKLSTLNYNYTRKS